MKIRKSPAEKTFEIANILFLLVMCAVMLIPILHVVAGSLSSKNALTHSLVGIWPVEWTMENYKVVFTNTTFWRAFSVSVFLVIAGTLVNILMTVITAYPLAKTGLKGRRAVMLFIIFTMIFSAPLIPSFLVVKALGLLNTIWALIIPSALSAFNMILCLTFFRSLPEELFEAARVDGMNEYRILFRIAIPLSVPILVTLLLFYAVGHWNSYYSAMLYISNAALRPLQLYLYSIVAQASMADLSGSAEDAMMDLSPQGLQMATIIVATVPIVLIYPFIQRHFIKGALIGSLKE
ncbi:carbohydrate ABC transporter permease [Paenibacillus sp. YN15]|uniref:carbohydrate ABC transporter permease n=1 Tax=Paenibacillus sp. YN15 TaxID=1742774 RepID=UPI000DCF341E|nr:carbohydrate ABC transporter permease [Paenibacillus sp. YN15]RAU91463.1 ABC transporter permease [Paenibacillus sp. YN15]